MILAWVSNNTSLLLVIFPSSSIAALSCVSHMCHCYVYFLILNQSVAHCKIQGREVMVKDEPGRLGSWWVLGLCPGSLRQVRRFLPESIVECSNLFKYKGDFHVFPVSHLGEFGLWIASNQ